VKKSSVFFVNSGVSQVVWQAASLGVTAAVMGQQVYFIFGSEALVQLARQSPSAAVAPRVASAAELFAEAKQLGAKFWSCETVVELCHLKAVELLEQGTVDEVVGLAQIWRVCDSSTVYNF
jgi:predicted peroxiredoxin